jgi:hypothetical protein
MRHGTGSISIHARISIIWANPTHILRKQNLRLGHHTRDNHPGWDANLATLFEGRSEYLSLRVHKRTLYLFLAFTECRFHAFHAGGDATLAVALTAESYIRGNLAHLWRTCRAQWD